MRKIIINTGNKKYPVVIGSSILSELPDKLKHEKINNNIYILLDKNVAKFHLALIKATISSRYKKFRISILPPGEKSKTEYFLKKIYSDFIKNKFGRDTTLIAIGGGVTGDLAGYAAATYMRGIHLVHVPTTLLAMIDSSIGGKTGINFERKKNIIGSFYQPKLVFIDVAFLTTLPKRELASALGELVKYGLITNLDFYKFLSANINKIKSLNYKILERTIRESILIKNGVVSIDEFELEGKRKILNLGHTFAHAIESNLQFKIKHGEAVVAGILCALFLSNQLGLLKSTDLEKLLKLPLNIPLPKLIHSLNMQRVYNTMLYDKKNRNEKIMFVLFSNIGNVFVDVPASKSEVIFALEKMKKTISV